jgi:hypothetical protein
MNMNMEKPILRHSGSCLAGNDRGSALLMTLGVLLLMMVIGLGFIFSAIVDRDIASAQADANKARLAAESANARGMAILEKAAVRTSPNSFAPLALFPNPATGYYSLTSSEIDVKIFNRSGKLDPNWFGLPSHYFKSTAAGADTLWGTADDSWQLAAATTTLSVGSTPIGMNFSRLDGNTMSTGERNILFAASPELRGVLLPAPDTTTTWNGWATIPKKNQVWISRDQIFTAMGWDITNYNLVGNSSFNRDYLFPHSHEPLSLDTSKPLSQQPMPWIGGSNTFIDWPTWRDVSTLPATPTDDTVFKMRVPFPWFSFLDFSAASAGGDVKFATTYPDGITPIPYNLGGANLTDKMPWFRFVKAQRSTDLASYYELAANFKDYVNSGDIPTNNLWPAATNVAALSSFCNAFVTSLTLSNPIATTPYPYCGTKAVPSISEIQLDFDKTQGLTNLTNVELVNFYPEQQTYNLNDLAVILEVEWTDGATTRQQKIAVGFASTGSVGYLNTSVNFCRLYPTSAVATTTGITITKVRAYLVRKTGIGANVTGNTITSAVLQAATLLDAAVIDGFSAPPLTFTGTGTDGALGTVYTDPNTKISKGDLFFYNTDVYVATKNNKSPLNLYTNGDCIKINPQPNPKGTNGIVSNIPTSGILPGDLYYSGTIIYIKGTTPVAQAGTMMASGSGAKSVYLESRDPRNNTRLAYGGKSVWTIGLEGSMGWVNPDWWDAISVTPWIAGMNVVPGDRVSYSTKEYEVILGGTSVTAPSTDTTHFRLVSRISTSCGRNVWMGGDLTEDAANNPAIGSLYATTVDNIVKNYIRPSTAYVRCGAPQSLWELGAINRAEPWRTVKLGGTPIILGGPPTLTPTVAMPLGSYEFGDWMLLDEVSLRQCDNWPAPYSPSAMNGYATENGKVNPNPDVSTAPGLNQLCQGLGSFRAVGDTNPVTAYAGTGAMVFCTLFATVNVAGFSAAPILSRGELIATPIGIWNDDDSNSAVDRTDVAGRTMKNLDRNQEEIVGKLANLLQTRYQYFEIQAIGRYVKTNTEVLPNVDIIRAGHTIRAIVERDAYTGKTRTISTEHIDQ